MSRIPYLPFQKNLLVLAISAGLAPATTWALNLVQEPPLPTSKSAFVAPNVIISIDDSGSMNFGVKTDYTVSNISGPGYSEPDADGKWKNDARRVNVLKYSLNKIFNDKDLIPENKLRIAWQSMNNGSQKNVNAAGMVTNSMRPIDAVVSGKVQRANFLTFINNLSPNGSTPLHQLPSQADAYMRRPLNSSSPWATDPGGTGSKATEYLGCRRNYHILMTDGRWNGTVSGGDQDGKNWPALGDRQAYSTTSDQTRIYYDDYSDTISDWAFKSWMDPLQNASNLKDSDKLKPSKIYDEAPATEFFTATRDKFKIVTTSGSNTTQRRNACLAIPGEWLGGSTNNCKLPDGTETKSVDLQKYWNPEYDPATWPHMVTYTIGFSSDATTWPGASDIIGPSTQVPFGYDNSFVDLVTGFQTWPPMNAENKRALDLWHAAINGRGRFYAVSEAEDLAKAFTEIIGKINEESAPLPDEIAGGGSTSGYNVSQNNAGIFASTFSPKNAWSGYITATSAVLPEEYSCPDAGDPDKKCIRFPNVTSGWEGKTTADRLDDPSFNINTRNVISWSDASKGIDFKWSSTDAIGYTDAQKRSLLGLGAADLITTPLITQGQNIVNYIRGDRSLEGITPEKPLRVRFSREGDIVNSDIWYTGGPISNYGDGYSSFVSAQAGRTPILYVGGNDGMLHGFSATDGKEQLAYIPRGVIGGLKALTDKDYAHQYYVDGSPMTGDIKDASGWKTMLVGTLGAGGKGYFLLNVTSPTAFTKSDAVLDRTRGNAETTNCSTLTDPAEKAACNSTANEDKDIGNITSQPGRNPTNLQEATQITRLNNNRWAVILGNGYNSANQRPVLLVQYLDGDLSLKRIQATTDATGSGKASDNGLASPALIDLDGDGKTDVVYAGDNLGNLWKFDLMSDDDSEWAVSFGINTPLFTAKGPTTLGGSRTEIQPITAPPIVRPNDRMMTCGVGSKTVPIGGMMVAFGTGRNLTADDRKTDITQPIQTIYSVLDNTRYRTKAGTTHLQVHPGTGACGDANYVPTPAPVGDMKSGLLAQQSISTVAGDYATVTATDELKKETWNGYKGWYLDLPAKGERLLKPMQFFDGSNILAVYSETPNGTKNSASDNINESCVPVKVDTSAGSQFRTLINIMDGKRPSVPLVDYSGDGQYDASDMNVARAAVPTGTPILITKPNNIVDLTGGGGGRDTLARMPEQSTRPSWRQLK
ncbi:pilus assembly protein [Comamonas badia]|uniref:pilus assembly protein n=1 Tax=Comamonas badia TaxID=265291 RepID=UPI0004098DE9|nr:PilC/PilY family type IV pilus protein [Comamonas badia]